MSAYVLFNDQVPFAFTSFLSARVVRTNNTIPFQIKETMVNHKRMVHPPCVPAA